MWRVTTWDRSTGTGVIEGPHLSLSVSRDVVDVGELFVGEEVGVDLASVEPVLCARRVWPLRARQPVGTARPEFAEINQVGLWDFEVKELQRGTMTIIAGDDLMYSHEVEISFQGVAWYSGAFGFSHAHFRGASEEERQSLPTDVCSGLQVFCIVTEHGNGPDGPKCLVTAERVSVTFGTVYHYQRENLAPGERIAPWVSDSGKK
jgi:hypothetical protein